MKDLKKKNSGNLMQHSFPNYVKVNPEFPYCLMLTFGKN